MKKHTTLLLAGILAAGTALAGNPDRAGSAGAGQLLINPWAASNGLAGINMASVRGLESTFNNVAGLAFVNRNELTFSNSMYMSGTGISINSVGFATKVGDSGVLGLDVSSMSFGDIPITTEDLPEGGIGSFSPAFSRLGVSYAREFSNSIYGGLTMRIVSESISNVRASGVCFDAGIRYVTGENDKLRFGIALRNVGAPMRYAGDGLTVTATPQGADESLTVFQRSEKYELPSLVNIGLAVDVVSNDNNTVTINGQFVSNSFTKDQIGASVEANLGDRLVLRGGYLWEQGLLNAAQDVSTAYTGPAGGIGLNLPAGTDAVLKLDYSYRTTNPFNGTHTLGVKIAI
ncbi:MAG: PorV/PorQ family protein [Bacteroidota bacterium]|nr:PorV/PorQ family protein [Bacteroidota bacterium]